MPKIISFTGSHNTGKSVVSMSIKKIGLSNIYVDDFSVPRSVQQDYGVPLTEIVSDPANIPAFQEKIISRMLDRLEFLKKEYEGVDYILTDRSPIDFYAYSKLWNTGVGEVHSEWLSRYKKICAEALLGYDFIFFMPIRKFPFVAQPDRGSMETQRAMHNNCKDFIRTFARPMHTIRTLSIEDRVSEVLEKLKAI